MRLTLLALLALFAAPALAAEDSPPSPVSIGEIHAGGDGNVQAETPIDGQCETGESAGMEVIHARGGSDSVLAGNPNAAGHPNSRELAVPHDLRVHAWSPYDGADRAAIPDGGRRTAGFDGGRRGGLLDDQMHQRNPMVMSRAGNGRTRNLYQRGEPVAQTTV